MNRTIKFFATIVFTVFVFQIAKAEMKFKVTLTVNDEFSSAVWRNQPALFTVSVSNPQAAYDLQWNAKAETYLNELRTQLDSGKITAKYFGEERKRIESLQRKIEPFVIGNEVRGWFSEIKFRASLNGNEISLPVHLLGKPKMISAMMNENSYYSVQFGISPAEMEKIIPGNYEIDAELSGNRSEKIQLQVNALKATDEWWMKEENIAQFVQYFLADKNAAKVAEYAEKILLLNPASVLGLTMKGEALILDSKYKEALRQFENALKETDKNPAFEPPVYIHTRIEFLKDK